MLRFLGSVHLHRAREVIRRHNDGLRGALALWPPLPCSARTTRFLDAIATAVPHAYKLVSRAARALFLAGADAGPAASKLLHYIYVVASAMILVLILVFCNGSATAVPHAYKLVPSVARALVLAGRQHKGRATGTLLHSVQVVANTMAYV